MQKWVTGYRLKNEFGDVWYILIDYLIAIHI